MNTIRSILFLFTYLLSSIVLAMGNVAEVSGTLMVRINFIYDEFSISKAWVIDEIYPARNEPRPLPDDLVFQLVDSNSEVLLTTRVRNPKIIRIPLPEPDKGEKSTLLAMENRNISERYDGNFILRFPYSNNVQFIDLIDSGTTSPTNISTTKARIIPHRMDVTIHLSQ